MAISIELRERIVAAYRDGLTKTYASTAEMFGVGEATVSRLLRRYRETGDVKPKPTGGNNPRRIDLEWLRAHARNNPDARLIDRIADWETKSGVKVSVGCMWNAMREIGWTHKKKRLPLGNATDQTLKRSGSSSS
ncbi:MAG: helix-turn-helix domain-containing protein [Myxococcota bacterium]